MPSFDVISKIDYQEFDNALANCLREISNRYDFKGLHISIERKDKLIENRKAFKNEEEIKKHISFIKDEIAVSNKAQRMLELKNWLDNINKN